MRHGSLFSGIGGFDLAAEWMGWDNVFHCEWNEFGQKVLKYYWPKAISYADITKTDFTIHRGSIDILTGGFPCQPYSQAGKRKGKEDERHLWPEMLRAIGEIQPSWVVGENVLGLVNWNGGLVFDEVQADLEAKGYEVQPFILPACALNAPHRRDRVWFIAYSIDNNRRRSQSNQHEARQFFFSESERLSAQRPIANTDSVRQRQCQCKHEINTGERGQHAQCNACAGIAHGDTANTCSTGRKRGHKGKLPAAEPIQKRREPLQRGEAQHWSNWPTQSPVCNGNDGFSSELDGITFPKWRNESIKAGGNAIVPQVAHQIFQAIQQYATLHPLNR